MHLGEDIFWQSDVSIDFFDPAHRQSRLEQRQLKDIESAEELSDQMGISLSELRWLCYHREAAKSIHYHRFTIPKKSGGERRRGRLCQNSKLHRLGCYETLLNA